MVQPLSIVADRQILFAKEAFSKFGEVSLVDGRSIDEQTIKHADVLLVRSVTNVDESLLKGSTIRFVGSATSGIDHIDLEYLEKSNIHFSHAPGSNARSVAEYVLSSLLVMAEYQGFSLSDKTVGIIGCGQVGSRVKRFMQALGVRCLLNDPPLFDLNSDESYVDLEYLYQADIITLHVPLTLDGKYQTHKLVNKSFLDRLKSNVIFVNTARGEVVDETALLNFKKTNPNSRLILDVWCNEPEINTGLLQEAFIATPHIAGYSYDGKLKATAILAEALGRVTKLKISDDQLPGSEQITDTIGYEDNDAVQLAVMQSYDVRSDAIALANLLNLPVIERAGHFDSLRKNYPVRHEFTNRIIQANKINHESRQQLQQLGFKVVTL